MRVRASLSIVCLATMVWDAAPVAAVEVTPTVPAAKVAQPKWAGYAVSSTGRVFSEQSAEEDRARAFARRECERETGASCRAIAVPRTWKVAAVQCGNAGFIAGVPFGSALALARQKAAVARAAGVCRQVFAR